MIESEDPKVLMAEKASLLRYMGERHTEWGFKRALRRIAQVDAALVSRAMRFLEAEGAPCTD